jgi:hypothetical protein
MLTLEAALIKPSPTYLIRCCACVSALPLQELFLSSLLPDRKLRVLEQQPLQVRTGLWGVLRSHGLSGLCSRLAHGSWQILAAVAYCEVDSTVLQASTSNRSVTRVAWTSSDGS